MARMTGTRRLAQIGFEQAGADVKATQSFRYPDGTSAPFVGRGPSAPPPVVEPISKAAWTRSLLPPWQQKLGPVSKDFSVQDFRLVLPAGVGAFVDSPSFQLPGSNVGWLQQLQLYVLGSTALTDVLWQLRFNEAPVSGFADKRNFPGVANLVAIDLNALAVRVPQGALIDVRVINQSAAGPWTVGAGFAGWHHDLQAELDRWGPVG